MIINCRHGRQFSEVIAYSSSYPPHCRNFQQTVVGSLQTLIASADGRVDALGLSPDGRSAIFSSQGRVFRVAVDGGTPQLLFEVSKPENLQCTARPANFCAYGSNSKDGRELVITEFDPDNGNRKELLHVPNEPGHRAQWGLAPDGSEVAVLKSVAKNEIEFIPLRGAQPRIFPINGYQWPNGVVWTPDSKGLFSGGINVTNGSPTVLHTDRQGHVEAVWHQPNYYEIAIWAAPSPDGRYIAIAAGRSDHDVWMIDDF